MYSKLRCWINNNAYKSINIKLTDIILEYDIHNTGKFNPGDDYVKILPCVVKKKDDKYVLIANWYAYTYFRYLNLLNTKITCIVIDEDRDTFFNNLEKLSYHKLLTTINIDKIIIPNSFNHHLPKDSKINSIINYYNKNKKFDRLIKVNSNNVIIDGFARYLAAKKLGLKNIDVIKTIVTKKEDIEDDKISDN